jgi:hypothetical protein
MVAIGETVSLFPLYVKETGLFVRVYAVTVMLLIIGKSL